MYYELTRFIDEEILPLLFPYQDSHMTIVVAILCLCVGSFLNVVIFRSPLKMEILQHETLLEVGAKSKLSQDAKRIHNKDVRSVCLRCGKQLRWYHNIPLLSYLFSLGKCRLCGDKISVQYPIIEALTAIVCTLSFVILFNSTLSVTFLFYVVFVAIGIAISVIDYRHTYIIDKHNLIYLLSGLVVLSTSDLGFTLGHFMNAILALLALWLISILIAKVKGVDEAMGEGDYPLLVIGLTVASFITENHIPLYMNFYVLMLCGLFFVTLFIKWLGKEKNSEVPFAPAIVSANLASLAYVMIC